MREINLRDLGVHDLRNIARTCGVPRPTMKLKEELIASILEARAGKLEHIKLARSGRAAKCLLSQQMIEEFLFPDCLAEMQESRNREVIKIDRNLTFAQSLVDNEIGFSENKDGYIAKRDDVFYFVDVSKDQIIFVPNDVATENELEVGDYVVASCISKDNSAFIVKDILKINDADAKHAERQLCSIKDIQLNEHPKVVEDITEGGKVKNVNFSDIEEKENLLDKIKTFREDGFKIIVVAVALPADGLLRIKRDLPNCIYFVSYYEDAPLYSVEAVVNATNHIAIRARMGEKLIVLVINSEDISDELKLYFPETKRQLANSSDYLKVTRKLLGLNRCLINNGSITIITATDEY